MIVEIIKGTSPVEVGIGLIREDIAHLCYLLETIESKAISIEERLLFLEARKGFWERLWERIRASIKF